MSDVLSDLPPEVAELIKPHVVMDQAVLDTIGVEIAAKREEAKAARSGSGIEGTWEECEDAYAGIDDANRHEFTDGRWVKPLSPDGPVTTGRRRSNTDHRSTVFHRITTRYVDAAVAKLGEILLPPDDKAFSLSETPVPELIEAKEDESQVVHEGLGVPLTRPVEPGETPPAPPQGAAQALGAMGTPDAGQMPAGAPAQPAEPPRVPLTVKDLALENIEQASKKAKAAETRIHDWMVETQYRAEIRKVIADAARIGVGVLKGPVPQSKRGMMLRESPDKGLDLQIREKIIPGCVWVDPWNIFPDPACAERICDGDYVFERDFMSARQVRGLKKLPGYIEKQIDKVLEEGPNKINVAEDGRATGDKRGRGRFEVWYFWGVLTKDEMRAIDHAAGTDPPSVADDGPNEAHAIVTLINHSVVRAAINPLDSGNFPYHAMPWQRRAKSWAGVGVAEQMRAPQKIVNAALRALLNNAGKSAGSQMVINGAAVRPADESWSITPDKIWLTTEEGPADVRQAMMAIQIPNVTAQILEIITMGERFAEETTSIPLITQGQSGATTPDTFGAAQLQNNNANQLLRSIGYAFDDYITEPVVRQYYEYLLLDPAVPNEEKGEFQIDAHGSAALVERAIQDQTIGQMGGMAANPIYGIDPKKWAAEYLKSHKLKPSAFQYTEEELAKMAQSPPPEAPQVTVARINADTQIKLGVMKQTADQRTAEAEGQIAAAAHVLEASRAQTEQQKVHVDATLRAHQLEIEKQRALDEAKTALAKTAMELQVEQQLNAANNEHDRAIQPPVQAPGRAANGHAFDQSTAH